MLYSNVKYIIRWKCNGRFGVQTLTTQKKEDGSAMEALFSL